MHIDLKIRNGELVVRLIDDSVTPSIVLSESSVDIKDIIAAIPNNAMPTDDLYIHGAPRHNQQILTREQNEALLLAELKNKPT